MEERGVQTKEEGGYAAHSLLDGLLLLAVVNMLNEKTYDV